MSRTADRPWAFLLVFVALLVLVILPAGANSAFAKKPVKPTPTPAPEPDAEIVYVHKTKSGGAEIAVMNADGSNQTTVVDCGTSSCTWPDWSPDGSQIIFVSNAFELSDPPFSDAIYVVDVDGGNLRKIVDLKGGPGQPTWSPVPISGQHWIVYSDETPSNPCSGYHDLYAYGVTDGAVHQLTYYSDITVDQPSWSADGTNLAARMQWELHPWYVTTFIFEVDVYGAYPVLDPVSAIDCAQWGVGCGFWSPEWSNVAGDYRMLAMEGLETTYLLDFGAYPDPIWDDDAQFYFVDLVAPPDDLRQQVPDDFLPLYVQYGKFSPDNTRFVFQGMVREPILKATGIYTASTDNSGPVVELASVGINQGSYEMPEWRPQH